MFKPRINRPAQAHEGAVPVNIRESAAREQARGLAIPRVEPSHQHNHDRKMQAMRRVKRAK